MASCVDCKDANYCYYPGGAPSNHSCDNWSPSDEYKARKYDERFNAGHVFIEYVENSIPTQPRTKPMTNFEKIKSMSVEELAKAMCDTFDCNCCPCAQVDNLFFEAHCPVDPRDGWKLIAKLLNEEVGK